MRDRFDKLMSREFLAGLLFAAVMLVAYAMRPDADYNDLGFWLSVAFGLPTGALTVQKAVGGLVRGTKQEGGTNVQGQG